MSTEKWLKELISDWDVPKAVSILDVLERMMENPDIKEALNKGAKIIQQAEQEIRDLT